MVNRWLLRRLLTSGLILLAALVINFAIPRLMPGNPVDVFAGGGQLTVEARQALIQRFGLDAPLWEQFWRYLVNAFRADFGLSFYYFPAPVREVIARALPWTLTILLPSILLQVVLGFLLGAAAAWRAGSRLDGTLQTISLSVFSTPLFWVAMVLLYVFGFRLGWFPLGGSHTVGMAYLSTGRFLSDVAWHAALPVVALTLHQYASYQLIFRNTMAGVLEEQYILIARAKGLDERRIKYWHAGRNALLPMVSFLALSLPMSVGGSVFVETVFSYPGIGRLIYDAVLARDYPLLQGSFFILSILVILGNLAADLAYRLLDPRIRY